MNHSISFSVEIVRDGIALQLIFLSDCFGFGFGFGFRFKRQWRSQFAVAVDELSSLAGGEGFVFIVWLLSMYRMATLY